MPLYEYYCKKCDRTFERLRTSRFELKHSDQALCSECMRLVDKIMSPTKFRIVGFSSANGYNLPDYDDVINADGHAKKRWGKKYN